MSTTTTIAVRIGVVSAMARRAMDPTLTARAEEVTDLSFALLSSGGGAGPVVEALANLAGELEAAMVRRGYNRREIPGIIRRDCEDAGLPVAVATVDVKMGGMNL
jgi:hypothetical protein